MATSNTTDQVSTSSSSETKIKFDQTIHSIETARKSIDYIVGLRAQAKKGLDPKNKFHQWYEENIDSDGKFMKVFSGLIALFRQRYANPQVVTTASWKKEVEELAEMITSWMTSAKEFLTSAEVKSFVADQMALLPKEEQETQAAQDWRALDT